MAARSIHKKRRRQVPQQQPRAWRGRLRAFGWRLSLFALVALAGYVAWLDLSVRNQFEGKRWAVPAQIYARPLEIYAGMELSADDFARELATAGYHTSAQLDRPGSYFREGNTLHVATRAFDFWDGKEPARRLQLRFDGQRLASLRQDQEHLPLVRLDPALVGRIYPAHHEDRILIRLDEVPPLLVKALIAVEDRSFFSHLGLSPRGIGRALYANLRALAPVQGGSTLTQQLAKNFFLTDERSLGRKLNEAIIALLLEAHYTKEEILEAYLNEIYLGQQGGRAIHGFGLASQFYFGRPLAELQLPELALLVAQVRGASFYNPRRNPKRALKRRNLVLETMAEQGFITPREAARARSRPLGVIPKPSSGNTPYPAFLDLVRQQLKRDYRDEDLRSEGLRIFTTLDLQVQWSTERALSDRTGQLEKEVRIPQGQLQGAAVVTNSESGEVLALVGGRDPRLPGFNRVLDAVRPIGSLIKPAIYLTALEMSEEYTLVSELDDGPLSVGGLKGNVWSPRNYDGKHHGRVPLYRALANSYNLATVRLGLSLGLGRVVDTLHRLGVERDVPAYPSMLLGAVALSPLEVTQMYQTLASAGFRMPLRAIREVTDPEGRLLQRDGLSVVQAFDPGPVFLLTRAMEEVMHTGTGRSVNTHLARSLTLAGKTGTTDDLRDSWFAGFSGDRVAVVWLGMDNNEPARLSGASGALRVWGDVMQAISPRALIAEAPDTIEWHWTDLGARLRTDADCPGAQRMPYIAGSAPIYTPCGTVGDLSKSKRDTTTGIGIIDRFVQLLRRKD